MELPRARTLRELFGFAGGAESPVQYFLQANDIEFWPESAVDDLKSAKLIKSAPEGDTVVCRGCEERCLRPILLLSRGYDSASCRVSTCDLDASLGPFFHSSHACARWQSSREMIVHFVTRGCSLTLADCDVDLRRIRFKTAEIKNTRRTVSLEFSPHPVLRIGSSDIKLEQLIAWGDKSIAIDVESFWDFFLKSEDSRSGDRPYQSSRTLQAANKLRTELRDQRMQKCFEKLARRYPKLNKERLAVELRRDGEFSGVSLGRVLRIVRMPKRRSEKK